MGREIKRVHIDFDLFERKGRFTWDGYLLDEIECLLCKETGKNLKNKICPLCDGEGKCTPKVEPSEGLDFENTNGYQVWQDVTEGGPVSPVFLKPEDLAEWMVENDDSITRGTSYEGWLKMIKEEGSAPSGIMSSQEGIKSGVEAIYDTEKSADCSAKK